MKPQSWHPSILCLWVSGSESRFAQLSIEPQDRRQCKWWLCGYSGWGLMKQLHFFLSQVYRNAYKIRCWGNGNQKCSLDNQFQMCSWPSVSWLLSRKSLCLCWMTEFVQPDVSWNAPILGVGTLVTPLNPSFQDGVISRLQDGRKELGICSGVECSRTLRTVPYWGYHLPTTPFVPEREGFSPENTGLSACSLTSLISGLKRWKVSLGWGSLLSLLRSLRKSESPVWPYWSHGRFDFKRLHWPEWWYRPYGVCLVKC